ncbi:hypothetical protein [Sulfuricurvum sp.]|uniref:hypothetical protein n=1 Tax=Sulfuricurvum sp. TaxID=2025608 RepID=UPI0035684680
MSEIKQKSLFEDDNLIVTEKDREPQSLTEHPKLDYSTGITQESSIVTVTITIPVKNKLDLDVLKDDMKVATGHVCMLVNIRDREASDG